MAIAKKSMESDDTPDNQSHSQSLYRKWRSQTFDELVGQEAVTRTLKNAIATGRVGHAYLFCGPRGTGKTSTARLLAKAISCLETDVNARPCNKCEACLSISEGRAMDLIEIDAASNRGIEDIRDLLEKINFQPNALRKKFYIIDEVHMLTEPAFNALLKTLEEPPPHAIFVLATTDPQDIPATVLSRCQRFDFQRISLKEIVERLQYVCLEEKVKAEKASLELVARQATGSLRDALSLLDQLIVFSEGNITLETVKQMLGVMNSEAVPDFVEALLERELASGLEQISNLVQSGVDLKRFNRELVEHLRGMMLLKANPDARELLDLPNEILERMQIQAKRINLAELIALLKIFSGVDYNLKVSPYTQLPLEIALMEAVLVETVVQPQVVTRQTPSRTAPNPAVAYREPPVINQHRPTVQKESATMYPMDEDELPIARTTNPTEVRKEPPVINPPRPVAPANQKESPTTDGANLSLAEVQQVWGQLLDKIGSSQVTIKALLTEASPVGVEGKQIMLAFKYQFHREKISQEKNRIFVEEQCSQILGRTVYIQCVADEGSSPNSAEGSARTDSKNSGKGSSPLDERSRAAARIFNATVQDFD